MPASPEQLQAAYSYCIDFARTMLEDSGEFHPFGAQVLANGEVGAVGGLIEGQEHPKGQDVYALLVERLRAELVAGRALGIAIAANVNIPEQYSPCHKDGARVGLETDGYARFIYVPYRLERPRSYGDKLKLDLAEPFSVGLTPQA